jgi:hypothetical protein
MHKSSVEVLTFVLDAPPWKSLKLARVRV